MVSFGGLAAWQQRPMAGQHCSETMHRIQRKLIDHCSILRWDLSLMKRRGQQLAGRQQREATAMRPSSFFGGSCSISSILRYFHFSTFCCALCVAPHILICPALRMSIRAVPVPVPQSLLWTAQAVLSRTGGSSGSPPPPTPPLRLTRSFRLVGSRHASSCGGRRSHPARISVYTLARGERASCLRKILTS